MFDATAFTTNCPKCSKRKSSEQGKEKTLLGFFNYIFYYNTAGICTQYVQMKLYFFAICTLFKSGRALTGRIFQISNYVLKKIQYQHKNFSFNKYFNSNSAVHSYNFFFPRGIKGRQDM